MDTKRSSLIVAGVLSGTSADGISCVIAEISHSFASADDKMPQFDIKEIAFDTIPWKEASRQLIFRLFRGKGDLSIAEVCEANFILGEEFANTVLHTMKKAGLSPNQVDLIGSHGQTVWHNVNETTGRVTSTLQIGEPAIIAERTGITTIADFRVADVAAGGQGAPLTSTLDWMLLRPQFGQNKWRALQNIGGIGNVTLLPPIGTDQLPLAFDTGPGNVFLDWFTHKRTNGVDFFDKDGNFGRSGAVHPDLLALFMRHEYFARRPPKTTGRELFSSTLAEEWDRIRRDMNVSDKDFMATLVDVTAISIAQAYKDFMPPTASLGQVLVSGGGCRNLFLMERIKFHLGALFADDIAVDSHDTSGSISAESKEAILFALLAYLCYYGIPGNVPACTSAASSVVLGKICPGRNFGFASLKG